MGKTMEFTNLCEICKVSLVNAIRERMPRERIDINDWLCVKKPRIYVHKLVDQPDLWGNKELLLETSPTKKGIRSLQSLHTYDLDALQTLCRLLDETLNGN